LPRAVRLTAVHPVAAEKEVLPMSAIKSVPRISMAMLSTTMLALSLGSVGALADMPNTAQDAMLSREGSGPPGRFHSVWRVDCNDRSGAHQCEVSLRTADRESQGYTRQLDYPLHIIVDRDGPALGFTFGETAMPAGKPVNLVLDGQVIATMAADQRVRDPAVIDRLMHGGELLVSVGSFADGPRVRSYMMLDGLPAALADAQRRAR
jgi:hypothetical protein